MLKKFITLENGLKKLKQIIAAHISYDNTSSGLTASNLQDAVDEVVSNSPDLFIGGVSASYVFTAPQCVGGSNANGN